MKDDILMQKVQDALLELAQRHGAECPAVPPAVVPPDSKMGDAGFPMFTLAKAFHASPAAIAKEAAEVLQAQIKASASVIARPEAETTPIIASTPKQPRYEFLAVGPYLNVRLDRQGVAADVLSAIMEQGADYGRGATGQRVMVEFSCPNTNKPLHLGHLRNDALGESLSRILAFDGNEVMKVDLINDRGVHIMKSMKAYQMNHEAAGDTPESLGVKGDHFVGRCYVEYAQAEKDNPAMAAEVEDMLVKWEAGDKPLRDLWAMMNKWTIDGINETYRRTGVSFDKVYYESQTYLLGKDEVKKGLDSGVFFRAPDGSVRVDITEAVGAGRDGKPQEKVLLRGDGTSVYITQDFGTAIMRHNEWPYDKMIYVVAAEQSYHFKALFFILRRMGYEWAERLVHLSYGLVNLPQGRMKSREGTVVDADDLIDSLKADALEAIKTREKDGEPQNDSNLVKLSNSETTLQDDIAEKVALGALHYYLLSATPGKDMLFDPKKSLSFVGDTGPYLQYMCARITSILRKAGAPLLDRAGAREVFPASGSEAISSTERIASQAAQGGKIAMTATPGDAEWALVKVLGDWPEAVHRAAAQCDPQVVAVWLMSSAKAFSKFYDECPILQADEDKKRARLTLARCTLTVMKKAMELVLVPYLERM